jgi:hypothetical protein
MSLEENFMTKDVKGEVKISVFDLYGNLIQYSKVHNTVTNGFRDLLAGSLKGTLAVDKFEIGTGTDATIVGDTALGNSVFSKTVVNGDLSRSDNVLTTTLHVASGEANSGSPTISEVGLFTNTGALLVARALIDPVVPKTASNTINIAWTWTFN